MKFIKFNRKVRVLNIIRTERLRRFLFIKWFFKKLVLKSIMSSKKLSGRQRVVLNYRCSFLPRYSSVTQQKTRCIKTGRAHMPFRFCLLSRMYLKIHAKSGHLPFLSKSRF